MIRRRALVTYVVLLHLTLVLLVWKPEAAYSVKSALLGTGESDVSRDQQVLVEFQLRADANLGAGAILFFGDSHVQGLCTACFGDHVANYGIGGDTAAGVLRRIKSYRSVANARAVVFAAGYNDLKRDSAPAVAATYREMLQQVPPSVQVMVSALFPIDPLIARSNGVTNAAIHDLNARIFDICAERTRCIFVDTAAKLAGVDGSLRRDGHVGDGVHLSPEAYAVWIADLRAALAGPVSSSAVPVAWHAC